jgi:hypothetical protein
MHDTTRSFACCCCFPPWLCASAFDVVVVVLFLWGFRYLHLSAGEERRSEEGKKVVINIDGSRTK